MSSAAASVSDDVIDLVSASSDSEYEQQTDDGESLDGCSVDGPRVDVAPYLGGMQYRTGRGAGKRVMRSRAGEAGMAGGGYQNLQSASSSSRMAVIGGSVLESGGPAVSIPSAPIGQKRSRPDGEQATDASNGEPTEHTGREKKKRRSGTGRNINVSIMHGCEVCGKVLYSARSSRYHALVGHIGQRHHECAVCGKRFSMADNLKRHMSAVHWGERRHECPVCGKRFSESDNLKRHVSTVHWGERRHECPVCGKRFSMADNLKRHVSTVHWGERRHECPVCGKRFSESGNLKRHVSTVHWGERRHECPVCGKRFSESGNLKRHVSTVHWGERRHECPVCGKRFSESGNLKRHMSTVHSRHDTKGNQGYE